MKTNFRKRSSVVFEKNSKNFMGQIDIQTNIWNDLQTVTGITVYPLQLSEGFIVFLY